MIIKVSFYALAAGTAEVVHEMCEALGSTTLSHKVDGHLGEDLEPRMMGSSLGRLIKHFTIP